MPLDNTDIQKIGNLLESFKSELEKSLDQKFEKRLDINNAILEEKLEEKLDQKLEEKLDQKFTQNNALLVEALSEVFAYKGSTSKSIKNHEKRISKIETHLSLASS